MEEENVKKEMAKRLASAMSPEQAQGVLIKVIDGDDLYDAILEVSAPDSATAPVKKRRYRKAKKGLPQNPDPVTE